MDADVDKSDSSTKRRKTSHNSYDDGYACEVCQCLFDSMLNLTRHMRIVHLIETTYSFVCEICDRVFDSESRLSKHKKRVHFVSTLYSPEALASETSPEFKVRNISCSQKSPPGPEEYSSFLCSSCGECLPSEEQLLSHEREHEETSSSGDRCHKMQKLQRRHCCPECGGEFTMKCNMLRHLSRVHGLLLEHGGSGLGGGKESLDVVCPVCDDTLKRNLLYQHLDDSHGVELDMEVLIFYSKEDFFKWKAAMETDTMTSFVTRSSSDAKALFICHRAGRSMGKWNGKKARRQEDTAKTGRWCPARITASYSADGVVAAKFYKTHLGHSQSVKYLRLSKAERAGLAGRIRAGESLDEILEDVRSSAPSDTRLHALTKRDLHNIVRDFGLHAYKKARRPAWVLSSDEEEDEEPLPKTVDYKVKIQSLLDEALRYEEEAAQATMAARGSDYSSLEEHSYCVCV